MVNSKMLDMEITEKGEPTCKSKCSRGGATMTAAADTSVLRRVADTHERARQLSAQADAAYAAARDAIRAARAEGHSLVDIARAAGVTRQRIWSIIQDD